MTGAPPAEPGPPAAAGDARLLIDSHCHLNDPVFAADLPDVIARAAASGVERMVVVGCDVAGSRTAVAMAAACAGISASVGVHPHDARNYGPDARAALEELLQAPGVVALGEIGLDYHYDFSPRDAQVAAFEDQLELARAAGLPVIVHCREAYGDTLDILERCGIAGIGGVMHCWGGDIAAAERALGLGMALGIAGTVTFKNAGPLREVVRRLPLDRLVIETDAPYLAPAPHRGQRNEPALVREVARVLAETRGIPVETVARATAACARSLFPRIA